MLDSFAGAIFTDQEVFRFSVIAFIIAGLLTSIVIFIGKRILYKATAKKGTNNTSLVKATLFGFGIITASLTLFFIIPTRIKDRNWQNKQQNCAKEVGYESPADDNSGSATAKEQSDYRDCLFR